MLSRGYPSVPDVALLSERWPSSCSSISSNFSPLKFSQRPEVVVPYFPGTVNLRYGGEDSSILIPDDVVTVRLLPF